MIPRERVLAAMNLTKPDRVPLMCQWSFGFINRQLADDGFSPMEVWLDPYKYAEALAVLCDRFCFDGILVSVHGHNVNWKQNIVKTSIDNGIECAIFPDRIEHYPDNDLPEAEFKVNRIVDISEVNPDSISKDLDFIAASSKCVSFIDMNNPYQVFNEMDNILHGKYSIHAEVSSPLDYLFDLIGYENTLLAMVLEPEKCKLLLERFTMGVNKMAEGLCKNCDIDAIKISSPFAGMGFISPEFYNEFELPYITRVVKTIRSQGKHVYVHTCGHINDRLEQMCSSGMTGIECLDPPPLGNIRLADAFRRIGQNTFIKGNIDSVNTLLNGTPQQINKDVGEILSIGMRNPGFILSTACSVAPDVSRDNLALLSGIIDRHGNYK